MANPITPVAFESDPSYAYEDEEGRTYDHYDITFAPEDWARIREGRACLRCWEIQEIPFLIASSDAIRRTKEKHLPNCELEHNGIQARQARLIAEEFYGGKHIGPKQRLEDAIAEDDEKRRKYQKDTGIKPGPWVPPWVKL